MCVICFFFFKQKTAYELRISDWSSDVCSSDLPAPAVPARHEEQPSLAHAVGAVLDLLAQPDRGDADFSLRDSIPGLVAASVERGSIGGGLLCRREKNLRIGRGGRLHAYPDRKSTRLNSSH